MEDVIPKYEVLYSDLNNHFIGGYLASRDFKIFMSEIGQYDQWKAHYENVKSQRSYFALGTDHEPGDAADTFGIYLNAIESNPNVEDLVTTIIEHFIACSKKKRDFSDVVQSMKISDFETENVEKIQLATQNHDLKEFPIQKEVAQKKTKPKAKSNGKDVFIVHGHNELIKHNVARTLSSLKLNPIILHEQSNEGLTVIEKFEKFSEVEFAVILLTFDDYGNVKNEETKNKRARQNVIFELGYFLSKLGRSKVLPLYEDGVELPSDMSGVLYTKIDESENWKFRLVKELKSTGFDVDANDIL